MSNASTSNLALSRDALQNNPFVAPSDGRCIINDLPAELLSQIFVQGAEDEHDEAFGNDDDSELSSDSLSELDSHSSHGSHHSFDSDDERHLPFELLVTRICKRWREVAIEIPSLWSAINFTPDTKMDMVKEYVRRAKGAPLDISIDCQVDDDVDEEWRWETESLAAHQPESTALVGVLDVLMPHVDHWRTFDVSVSYYYPMLQALKRFAECDGAPMLEVLALYHYEDSDDVDTFRPEEYKDQALVLFHNNLPKLRQVALWGVHLDWRNTTFLSNLHEIELAYHTLDVRPSYKDFLRILQSSPTLHTLTLCQSGPSGMPIDWLASMQEGLQSDGVPDSFLSITVPSVENLILAFLPPDYIVSLLDRIHLPNVTSLALDFEDDEYRPLVDRLCEPGPTGGKSLLSGVESLKLSGLPCAHVPSVVKAAEALANVKQLSINFNHVDGVWLEFFFAPNAPERYDGPGGNLKVPKTLYFPNLEAVSLTGLTGEVIRDIVSCRQQVGKPLKQVFVNKDDELDLEDEAWLKENVEVFELFEGSDDEDIEELDIEDIDEDDHDDAWEDEDDDDFDDGEYDDYEYDSETGVVLYLHDH